MNSRRALPPPNEGIRWGLMKHRLLTHKFSCENWSHLSICQKCFLYLPVVFFLEEALYFKKGNKYLLLATENLLGRDRLLYNELKLSYLELEESVKQWRNTKLLMKTSLIEKETGRLAEGENSCMSAMKKKMKLRKPSANPFKILSVVAAPLYMKQCVSLRSKRNEAETIRNWSFIRTSLALLL